MGSLPRYEAHCFGPFRVRRDGTALPDADFRRGTAKTLLKWFLLNPGVRAGGRELCEALWPDRPTASSSRLLHVTLHDLRHALEPALAARQASTFICSDGAGRHWFDDAGCWRVDVDEADRVSAQAAQAERNADHDAAIASYERLLGYYEQTFLPENIYDDTFACQRATREVAEADVLRRLLLLYLAEGLDHKALTLGLAMQERDPHSEEAIAAIAEVNLRQGNSLAARWHLEGFLRGLHQDTGLKPGPRLLGLWQTVNAPTPGDARAPRRSGA